MTAEPAALRPRNAIRMVIVTIALVALAAGLWVVREALLVAFGGIVLATLLNALAAPLRRKTRLGQRGSVLVVVLVLTLVLGLLGWLFGAQIAREVGELQARLPAAVARFQEWLARSPAGRVAVDALRDGSANGAALARAGFAAGALMVGLGDALLMLFAGIYFALDPGLYLRGALRLLPPAHRPRVRRALEDAGSALQRWLAAQLIVMASVALLVGIGLALLKVSLVFSLALLMGLLEFVPVVGPIVAAIPGILLGFAVSPRTAVYVALVYLVVQQLESNVLTPIVQRWSVELPPVIALIAILAAGLLFGALGVLFALPLAVVAMSLVKHLYVEDTLEPDSPGGRRAAPRQNPRP